MEVDLRFLLSLLLFHFFSMLFLSVMFSYAEIYHFRVCLFFELAPKLKVLPYFASLLIEDRLVLSYSTRYAISCYFHHGQLRSSRHQHYEAVLYRGHLLSYFDLTASYFYYFCYFLYPLEQALTILLRCSSSYENFHL